jgi:phosphopantetheinyl transferase
MRAADYLIEKYITKDRSEIQRGEHGKPFLPGNASVKFNLSHGGNYAVLAVSDKEIGVDIENLERKANIDKIAKRVFTEAEQDYIKGRDSRLRGNDKCDAGVIPDDANGMPDDACVIPDDSCVIPAQAGISDDTILRFFQIWTAKEAVMKATGRGFTLDPLSFSVVPFEKLCEADDKLWTISSNIHDGHMVSVAVIASTVSGHSTGSAWQSSNKEIPL